MNGTRRHRVGELRRVPRWRLLGRVGMVPVTVEDVMDLVGRLAALTRAGLPVSRAWVVLSDAGSPTDEVAGTVAAMAASGGSIGDGLRLAAGQTDDSAGSVLRWLAVASDVVDRTGAPMAGVLDGLAVGIRADLVDRDEREAALAGPKATMLLLAALPAGGIGLGAVLGADPVSTLFGSLPGRVCLIAGLAFWLTGYRWSDRLVAAAASVEAAGRRGPVAGRSPLVARLGPAETPDHAEKPPRVARLGRAKRPALAEKPPRAARLNRAGRPARAENALPEHPASRTPR